MVKRKRTSEEESPTAPFRQAAQVGLGAGMVGSMMPLMSNPSPGNLSKASEGMVGFAIFAPMAGMGFNAIDNIYKSGQKKKK